MGIDSAEYVRAVLAARAMWNGQDKRTAFALVACEGRAVAAFAVPPSTVDGLADSIEADTGERCIVLDVHAGMWDGKPDGGSAEAVDRLTAAHVPPDASMALLHDVKHARKAFVQASTEGGRWQTEWDWMMPRHRFWERR